MGLLKTLMRFGIVAIPFGIVLIAAGAYGLAGRTGITFTINERVVSAQEGSQIFSIVGIILLFGGIVTVYIGFKLSWLTSISIVLGSCSLIVPAIFLGMGYYLVSGIIMIVFGYAFLATIFIWLTR
jgi:hypothetical protein